MQKTRVILLLGPAGCGKGTQAKIIARNTGMIHISTGDLCREAVAKNTDLGKQVAEYMRNGDLVPDNLMIDVIDNRLQEPDAVSNGVILDGYPRTVQQADALCKKATLNVDRVIVMQVKYGACVERILSRRVDPVTGNSYSLKANDCSVPNDQEIANRLIMREGDDDEPKIQIRLRYYHRNIGQILNFFKGKIFTVDGSKPVQEVSQAVMRALISPIVIQKTRITALKQCAICLEPANYITVPCGHKCGCEGCLSQLFGTTKQCPICRGVMEGIYPVFDAGVNDGDEEHNDVEEAEQIELNPLGNVEMDLSDDLPTEPVEPMNPKITVGPWYENQLAIGIAIPKGGAHRVPVDICCVIDVSGSMAVDATFQDPNDESRQISDGLTILDIVKHSVKTVIHTLTDNDRVAIVAFSSSASIVFPLTEMNSAGKAAAVSSLERLESDGQTNIWAGLQAGLDSLRANAFSADIDVPRKRNLFLLTDGQPTDTPPKGEVDSLVRYLETYPDLKCQIHTFGFGYSLKSDLLVSLAKYGNGTFAFIPDAKIVGTCFVDAVANACSTFTQNAKVHLVLANGATFGNVADIKGSMPVREAPWGLIVNLGPLQIGQTRNIVVPMNLNNVPNDAPYLEVTLEYENEVPNGEPYRVVEYGIDRSQASDAKVAYIRNVAVTNVYDIIDAFVAGHTVNAVRMMNGLIATIAGFPEVAADRRVVGLMEDLRGRMSKALTTTDRFNRWGQHYLRAITRSHQLQQCTNFMDVGLQRYGGQLFSRLRDQGGQIFLTLELNRSRREEAVYQPARARRGAGAQSPMGSYAQTQAQRPPSPPPATSTYYAGSGGGCFDESTYIIISRNREKPQKVKIADVRKGDQVYVFDNNTREKGMATVRYVVRVDCGQKRKMVKFQDLEIILTNKHPIRIDGKWQAPINLVDGVRVINTESTSQYVYNMVLDRANVGVLINGSECVTFGHQIEEAWHPLYASDSIVQTIEFLSGHQGNEEVVTVSAEYLKCLSME
jgi:adenylate kinase